MIEIYTYFGRTIHRIKVVGLYVVAIQEARKWVIDQFGNDQGPYWIKWS